MADYIPICFLWEKKSEILGLKCKDIDLDRMAYTIRDTKSGDDEQTYFLPPEISKDIEGLLSDKETIFPYITDYRYYKKVKEIQLLSGFGKLTPHKYRSVITSVIIAEGASQTTALANLGHSTRSIFAGALAHYADVDRFEESKKAYNIVQTVLKKDTKNEQKTI